MTDRFIIDIPADFVAHPAVYEPLKPKGYPQARYAIRFPREAVPDAMVDRLGKARSDLIKERNDGTIAGFASSYYKPFVMIGDHNPETWRADWSRLRQRCEDWQIPLDTLLWRRALRIAVNVFEANIPDRGPITGIGLLGVKVLDDFTKSEELERLIAERRALFEPETKS